MASLPDKIRVVAAEGGDELRTSPLKIFSLGAAAVSLAFEWGSGNEALIAVIGGRTLQQTHEALQTAAAAGITSFTEQSLFGLLAAVAVANFPRTMEAIQGQFFKREASAGE